MLQIDDATARAAALHAVLREVGIAQVAYVPDAGHAQLIDRCREDAAMQAVALTSEEEGVAMLAGAWLGGQRGVLLLQSSGVGNCVNALALTATCAFPLLMIVTMRGQWGEQMPWQVPMGQATRTVLEAMGVIVYEVDAGERVAEAVEAAARLAFGSNKALAVLISQRVTGAKRFD